MMREGTKKLLLSVKMGFEHEKEIVDLVERVRALLTLSCPRGEAGLINSTRCKKQVPHKMITHNYKCPPNSA